MAQAQQPASEMEAEMERLQRAIEKLGQSNKVRARRPRGVGGRGRPARWM
jgi:hypothetical protein